MANAHSAHSAHSLSFPCMKPFFFRWVPFLFVLGGGLVGHQSQSLSVVPDADRTQVIDPRTLGGIVRSSPIGFAAELESLHRRKTRCKQFGGRPTQQVSEDHLCITEKRWV